MYRSENKVTQSINVPVDTLDNILKRHSLWHTSILLKIDVEGAELEVLKGATETLKHTAAVVLEVSLGEQFAGAPIAEDVMSFMRERGFHLFNIIEGGGILEYSRLARADFVFLKR